MTIEFPNQSRSYDANHHQIRFWGHDASREEALLQAFDSNRERIESAARKAYSWRGTGFYVLRASDL